MQMRQFIATIAGLFLKLANCRFRRVFPLLQLAGRNLQFTAAHRLTELVDQQQAPLTYRQHGNRARMPNDFALRHHSIRKLYRIDLQGNHFSAKHRLRRNRSFD
ncbi:hypothetical protein D3C74_249500 [compost metagenome]